MNNLQEAINNIRIIDGHEHIDMYEVRKERNIDFFKLIHYLESDMISAGMKRDILYGKSPLSDKEKAEHFLKYWDKTKNTTYALMIKDAMEGLYNMEDWSVKGLLALNEKVKAKTNDRSWFKEVLNDKSGIDLAFTLVQTTDVDFSLFRPILFLDFMFRLRGPADIEFIKKKSKMAIHSLKDYQAAVRVIIDNLVKDGMTASKLGHAYWRTLYSQKPTYHEAEQVFNRLKSGFINGGLSQQEAMTLQNFLIHYVIQCSISNDLPIQIHTGHQETSVSRNGNIITNSKVTNLIPILAEYPDGKFVLLHNGIPYHQEYLSIVKNFTNAYADFTWSYIISPTLAKQLLHQTIEMVPMSKIFGFGGDYNSVEGTYAHQKLARKIVGEVLTEKTEANIFSEQEAITFAKRIFRDNLIDFYKIEV
ncbi:amidohydrolase family protein [Scopulibacillus darangshiensis]|uniref:Amidohydrolase family protein n=1 Tax=Scopulibacillus darangshiensis TaxID=442528 RepID=A0A4R2P5Q2_9BACL|nr:amidohydrolase family protein [Scopulibacillus darangshiensis]TCP29454.1 amidohydrolase family protein [Scopulibacillus darangshiensis]